MHAFINIFIVPWRPACNVMDSAKEISALPSKNICNVSIKTQGLPHVPLLTYQLSISHYCVVSVSCHLVYICTLLWCHTHTNSEICILIIQIKYFPYPVIMHCLIFPTQITTDSQTTFFCSCFSPQIAAA